MTLLSNFDVNIFVSLNKFIMKIYPITNLMMLIWYKNVCTFYKNLIKVQTV